MGNKELTRLIQEGEDLNFNDNSYQGSSSMCTRASANLLSWIANIESYILNNYRKESGPYNLFQKFEIYRLDGYSEGYFIQQKSILLGAIKACKTLRKNENKTKDHPIIELLKTKTFWTVLVVTTGASFGLGLHFGSTKFDREKINLYEENRDLRNQNIKLTNSLKQGAQVKSNDSI